MGVGVNSTLRPPSTPGKDPVPVVREAGWATWAVRTGAEILALHWDSIPGPSSLQPVAISTELPGPGFVKVLDSNLG